MDDEYISYDEYAEYENYEENSYIEDDYVVAADMQQGNMQPIQTIPSDVLNSRQARAGIQGVMSEFSVSGQGGISGYSTQKAKNHRVTVKAVESLALELGANADIASLEQEWEKIYSKNEDVLKGYEPYYSIDATADGDVRELFRLRIGPVKSVKSGDSLCRKLGRRGFSCSVVRVQ
jgi:hypothetical protein